MAWKPGYSSTQPPTMYGREMSVAPPSPDSRRSPPVTCARACPRRMGALAGGWHVRFLRVQRFTPCARFLCVLASPQPVLAAHGRPTRRQLAARHAAERWCARAPRPVCAAWRAGVYFFSFQLPAREPPPRRAPRAIGFMARRYVAELGLHHTHGSLGRERLAEGGSLPIAASLSQCEGHTPTDAAQWCASLPLMLCLSVGWPAGSALWRSSSLLILL